MCVQEAARRETPTQEQFRIASNCIRLTRIDARVYFFLKHSLYEWRAKYDHSHGVCVCV